MSRWLWSGLALGVMLGLVGCRTVESKMEQRAMAPPAPTTAPSAAVPSPAPPQAPVPPSESPSLSALEAELTRIVARVLPAVVSIHTERTLRHPSVDIPEELREFFRFFPNAPMDERGIPVPSTGSGMIFRSDGYILTNAHVVSEAARIEVKLATREVSLPATLVGKDARTDLAILKLQGAPANLPTVVFGDSDKVQVGSLALAIGSPFEFESSVTLGVISAKGRVLEDPQLRGVAHRNLIQTDAPINPGNSGGPLVNIRGEVIGVNTAIYSPSGGNVGIGFAVPINTAKALIPELMAKGQVVRGYLGVELRTTTPDELRSLYQVEQGALVVGVEPNGPAAKAGIEAGDVIVEYNGQPVRDADQLVDLVTGTAPGSRVRIKVLREGKERTFTVLIGELPPELGGRERTLPPAPEGDPIGLAVEDVPAALAPRTGLPSQGAFIRAVQPGSPAERAGVPQGGVIVGMRIRDKTYPIRSAEDYRRWARQAQEEGFCGLQVAERERGRVIQRFYLLRLR